MQTTFFFANFHKVFLHLHAPCMIHDAVGNIVNMLVLKVEIETEKYRIAAYIQCPLRPVKPQVLGSFNDRRL